MLERIYIQVYVGTTYRLGQLRLPYICSTVLLLNYIGKRNSVHKVRTRIPHGSFGVWMEQDESADISQCWYPKLARFRFSEWSGQTGQTSRTNRSDRSGKVCQIVNWTTPLRRSHWDDRNAYMERSIWSPDEEVMSPGRPVPRSARSDRSRGGQTGPETGQTGPKRLVRVKSCILTRDLIGFRLLTGKDLPTTYIYIYEGSRPIEGNPNRFNTLSFTFLSKP